MPASGSCAAPSSSSWETLCNCIRIVWCGCAAALSPQRLTAVAVGEQEEEIDQVEGERARPYALLRGGGGSTHFFIGMAGASTAGFGAPAMRTRSGYVA